MNNETNTALNTFAESYIHIHGYVSICVCVFGIVTNIFNITVLTRKRMRTPVNLILTWLAVSDIITMLSYVPFAFHFYVMHPTIYGSAEKNTEGWMRFMIFHINLAATTHTISIWLCVLLAIVRYIHIRNPTKGNATRLKRLNNSQYMIIFIYITSALILIPNYMCNQLKVDYMQGENKTNVTIYVIKELHLADKRTELLTLVNVWMYGTLAKLVPCFLMGVFGSLLVYNIHFKIRQRRRSLQISGVSGIRLAEHSRTTTMLVIVITLFLITELPQGLLIVLSACIPNFFRTVYLPLGDVMDIVALVNNAINFVLYCTMSTKFRETFVELFCRKCRRPHENEDGYVLATKQDCPSFSNNNYHDV